MTMLRLRLRAWLGWGRSPDDLRVQSAQLFRAALAGFVGYGLLVPLLSLIVGMFYEPFGAFAHNLLATRSGLFYGGLLLALVLYLLIPATTRRRLASRGEGQPPVTTSGQCYEFLQGKSAIFARIGLSAETAQWYHLPLSWEAVVEPGENQYKLSMNPATGFVERLRRLGASPKEVRQFSAREVEAVQTGASNDLDEDVEKSGRATREQRRELKRTLRSFGPARGLEPQNFSLGGVAMVLIGLVPFGLTIWLLVLFSSNQWRIEPGAEGAAALLVGMTGSMSLLCIGYGIALLWIWRRLMATASEEPRHMEGVTVNWMPYGNPGYEPRADTFLRMRADDGSTEVFRIHRRWENRVRTPSQRFRVTYLPTTHRVLDLRIVDSQ
ncbi:MAG TPA: hypothetical protein VHR15_06095 [Ktedonobacterales bacterium]|jgi:hypothetical protein|nr:hypothetical protein [Ktedonobacterales bacterium]